MNYFSGTEIHVQSGTLDPSNFKGCSGKTYSAFEMAETKGHESIVKFINEYEEAAKNAAKKSSAAKVE